MNHPREEPQFNTIQEALEQIRAGQSVILVDDEDRENEGDLVMAAEKITPAGINFMAKHGRGLICLALTPERVEELKLPQQSPENTAPFGTAFTVSHRCGPGYHHRDFRGRSSDDHSDGGGSCL